MRKIVGLIALAAILASAAFFAHSIRPLGQDPDTALDRKFVNWILKQNKSYKTPEEYQYRKKIFTIYSNRIDYFNQVFDHDSALNKFTDLTEQEFHAKFTGFTTDRNLANSLHLNYVGTPERSPLKHVSTGFDKLASIDWRTKGAVNPVKDQGDCSSSWAFSATSTIESAVFLKSGKLLNLSEQQLLDCSGDFRNLGCKGGWKDWSFDYLVKVGGQQLASDYPYTARDGNCKFNKALVKASISSYTDVPANNCNALLSAITKQPVSVSINANDIRFYAGGVFMNDACSIELNHAVTAVGYGTENGKNYYLVRNSWGSDWGEDGYIRFSSDVRQERGICGICMAASYPNAN